MSNDLFFSKIKNYETPSLGIVVYNVFFISNSFTGYPSVNVNAKFLFFLLVGTSTPFFLPPGVLLTRFLFNLTFPNFKFHKSHLSIRKVK